MHPHLRRMGQDQPSGLPSSPHLLQHHCCLAPMTAEEQFRTSHIHAHRHVHTHTHTPHTHTHTTGTHNRHIAFHCVWLPRLACGPLPSAAPPTLFRDTHAPSSAAPAADGTAPPETPSPAGVPQCDPEGRPHNTPPANCSGHTSIRLTDGQAVGACHA